MDGLRMQLCRRGVAAVGVPKKMAARKDMRKELEVKRLKDATAPEQEAQALSRKHFKVLSIVQHKFVDDWCKHIVVDDADCC